MLNLPYHVYLEKGYFYTKAEPSGQSSEDCALSHDQSWKFTLQHSDGEDHEFERIWSYNRQSVGLLQLLYSFGGSALPLTPKNRNSRFNAYIKSHGKNVIQIDKEKVVDICDLLLKCTIEFERLELFEDLDKGKVLGYGLYDSILLVTLQDEDFEDIFHDKSGYLPTGVIYDEKTPAHTILFDNGHNSVEKFGNARFILTPGPIIKKFEGEIQTRMSLNSIKEECAKEQKLESHRHKPCKLEKDSHKESPEDPLPREVEDSVPEKSKARRKTHAGLNEIKREMHEWLYIYAFKLVLNAWEKGENDDQKRTQVALVSAAKDKLIELGIDEKKGEEFFVTDDHAKKIHKKAIDEGTLLALEKMFPREKGKS